MAKTLVIVESPAKAKTIKGYLGKGYQVLASYGHVRDLVPKEGAVDPEHDFAMRYQIIDKNQQHVEAIVKALKGCSKLLLATDQDREGEAISWHLHELLKEKKCLKGCDVERIVFNQITRKAIQEAVDSPRGLSQELIDAQQARRALDYLVGFKLSPLLWRKIRTGLSAGRVQSPALRMIVERELEIEAFESKEYWSILAQFKAGDSKVEAKCTHYKGEKLSQFSVTTEEEATKRVNAINKVAKSGWKVAAVKEKTRKKQPPAPFITATLQQEAVKKLGFSASRAMRVAQQLYEGITVDGQQIGLITYMRTDSVMLADDAIGDIRDFIVKKYGQKSLSPSVRVFSNKSKNAQEAHEAIRPTSIRRTPDDLKGALNDEQFKLYRMIWQRTIAGQMEAATLDQVSVDITDGKVAVFRANGSSIRDPGFLRAYQEGVEGKEVDDTKETFLPKIQEGETLPRENTEAKQHFTEPPARYSEASIVKALEEYGIGRPSTYASIISTLQARSYVTLEQKRFKPTDVGRIVNKFLTNYFTKYIDYAFPASLEDQLDAIARGEKAWIPILDDFWGPFEHRLEEISTKVQRKDVTEEKTDEKCPECQKELVIKLGRNGRFYGCSGYPECKFTKALVQDGEEEEPAAVLDRSCPKCESPLTIKQGRYGKFIGCTNYPACKHIEPLNKPEDTGVTCPECNKGTFLKRRARKGNFFYSCSGYPKCRYIVSHPQQAQPCPKCQFPFTMIKTTKRKGDELVCPNCKYTQAL